MSPPTDFATLGNYIVLVGASGVDRQLVTSLVCWLAQDADCARVSWPNDDAGLVFIDLGAQPYEMAQFLLAKTIGCEVLVIPPSSCGVQDWDIVHWKPV